MFLSPKAGRSILSVGEEGGAEPINAGTGKIAKTQTGDAALPTAVAGGTTSGPSSLN